MITRFENYKHYLQANFRRIFGKNLRHRIPAGETPTFRYGKEPAPFLAFDPRPFFENGSTADRLALILNRLEAQYFSGETDPEQAVANLLQRREADIIVLKMGGHGAMVATKEGRSMIPAYQSESIFKIGSGDVFSAAFTQFWAVEGRSAAEAAHLASRATSQYVNTRSLPIHSADELLALGRHPCYVGQGPGLYCRSVL
jgi:sugar/nucleoside kinase (ribokinase family)